MEAASSETSKSEVKKEKIERRTYAHMNQIEMFPQQQPSGPKTRTLIVADIPYNQNFEAKVMAEVNKIAAKFDDVRIYRKDFSIK